jgi:two-component system, NarL family, sensor kinase
MQMFKYFVLFFLYTLQLCTNNIFAQTNRIEVLKMSLNNASNSSQKLDASLALCEQAHSLNADTLYYYARLAKQLAVLLHDNKKNILADVSLEIWLGRKNLFDSALKMCNSDLKNISYTNAGDVYTKVLMQKCFLLMKSNRHKEALTEAYHFLQQAETRDDTLAQVYSKIMIGTVYRNMQQTEEALQWFYKAEHTAAGEEYAEKKNEYGIYFLTGMMYNWKADADTKQKEKTFDSLMCVNYLDKSIAYSRKFENMAVLARSLCIKADGIEDPKQLAVAGEYLNEAIHIYNQMHDTVSILNGFISISNYSMSIGQPQKGIAACLQGIEMIKRGNAFPVIDFYWTLAQCYKAAGDKDKYAETLNMVINLKDSQFVKNKAEALSEMEAKYDVQKKENIIIQQKLDLTKKNNLVYGTLILLAITVLVFYIIFQARKKNQQLKMQEVMMDQKRKTMDAVMQAEENERKRIAADLHDSVAQKMVVAKLNLEVLEGYLPSLNTEQRHVYNNIFSLVDDSCTEVRNLSHSMMPQAFFQSGLTDAVKNFIDKIENKNLRISFNAEGELGSLDNNMEIMIYRIIQECLQNIIKHADASKVDISISLENDEIDVTIEDNGVGFDTSLLEQKEGMGMKNIKSRVDFLNGQLDINSEPGNGTVIAFYVPVNKK